MYCLAKTATTLISPNNVLSYIQNHTITKNILSNFAIPIQATLDISNYFTNSAGICVYSSCDIVDSSGYLISWITGSSLIGNKCSFSILINVT